MEKQNTLRRRKVPAVGAAVQPVAKRLTRMEALLIEMRHEQDVKLKRIRALELQLTELIGHVKATANRRRATRRKT